MKTITISEEKYKELSMKARLDEELLIKLVRGLEDIRAARIKPWKKS